MNGRWVVSSATTHAHRQGFLLKKNPINCMSRINVHVTFVLAVKIKNSFQPMQVGDIKNTKRHEYLYQELIKTLNFEHDKNH